MVNGLISETHPKRYLIHKYWGRKAHNLMAQLISTYTKPGDVVLDPFMGSAVTLIEAAALNRKAIGYDLNPTSHLIAGVSLSGVKASTVAIVGAELIENLRDFETELYGFNCPECQSASIMLNAAWRSGSIVRVKEKCPSCGIYVRDADSRDFEKLAKSESIFEEFAASGAFSVPTEEIFKFVRRSGVTQIKDLFSSRALFFVALLLSRIDAVPDDDVRLALRLTFSSMLPNVSKMIPANLDKVTGRSGWQISKFWVPKEHTEKSVLSSFGDRLRKVVAGLEELGQMISPGLTQQHLGSADFMKEVGAKSVDFVFADPPYGDSIAYLALSHFWNSWLAPDVDYEREVIYDVSRKKGLAEFAAGLQGAAFEMRRVIKDSGHLVATFNNRHMKFWRPFIESLVIAGFELQEVSWVDQAVRSGTQGINRRNTLHGDFIYVFKPASPSTKPIKAANGRKVIIDTLARELKAEQELSSAELYCLIIPALVKKLAFVDELGAELNIEKELTKLFQVKESPRGLIWEYRG